MCGRAVGKKRKNRAIRKIEVAQAVEQGTQSGKGFVTLKDVSEMMGITASTYLLDILKELRVEKKVTRELSEDEQGRSYFRWTKLPVGIVRPKGTETLVLPRYYIHSDDNELAVIWIEDGGILISDNLPWAYPFLTSDLSFARKIANLLSVRVTDKREILRVSVYPEFEEIST